MITTLELEYPLSEGLMAKGFVAYNKEEKAKKPGILIVHDWGGRSEFYCNLAKRFAEQEMVGFAVDMYGSATLGQTLEEKRALAEPLKQNRPDILIRMQAALACIQEQPYVDAAKVAAVGYCFGGRCALDLVRSGAPLKGGICVHGILEEPNYPQPNPIQSKVLVLHGYEDSYVPPEQLLDFTKEMTDKKVDWQLHIYGNTYHGFSKPQPEDLKTGLKYDAKADKRAWDAMLYFLKESF